MKLFQNLSNAKSMKNAADVSGLLTEIRGDLLVQLQHTLLEMMLDVLRVCSEHNIRIFLAGGTALGAIRHKGFIPWDDDVDLCMTRQAYRQFVPVFEAELSDRYILNAPNYSPNAIARFPKILKKDSFMDTGETRDKALCRVFLDIFLIDPVPDNALIRSVKGLRCNCLEFIAGQVSFVENLDPVSKVLYQSGGRLGYFIRLAVGKLFSVRKAARWYDRIDRVIQYRGKNVSAYGLPTGSKHYFGEILPKRIFQEASVGEFEGHSVPLPGDSDAYLRNLYGDYMLIPPPEKRQMHFVRELRI